MQVGFLLADFRTSTWLICNDMCILCLHVLTVCYLINSLEHFNCVYLCVCVSRVLLSTLCVEWSYARIVFAKPHRTSLFGWPVLSTMI